MVSSKQVNSDFRRLLCNWDTYRKHDRLAVTSGNCTYGRRLVKCGIIVTFFGICDLCRCFSFVRLLILSKGVHIVFTKLKLSLSNINYKLYFALLILGLAPTVAFPLISSGVYGYPKDKALKVATQVIRDFLLENEMKVYIVIFDKAAYKISEKLFSDIAEYIDETYVDEHTNYRRERMRMNAPIQASVGLFEADLCACKAMATEDDLDAKLKDIDESFLQMLLRKIDEKDYNIFEINEALFAFDQSLLGA